MTDGDDEQVVREEESLVVRLENIQDSIDQVEEDVDQLKVDINPVLTQDPIEIENRLSSLEGKMELLLYTMIPVAISIIGLFITFLFG